MCNAGNVYFLQCLYLYKPHGSPRNTFYCLSKSLFRIAYIVTSMLHVKLWSIKTSIKTSIILSNDLSGILRISLNKPENYYPRACISLVMLKRGNLFFRKNSAICCRLMHIRYCRQHFNAFYQILLYNYTTKNTKHYISKISNAYHKKIIGMILVSTIW